MKFDKPITFNTNPITSSRKLRRTGRNLFFSLGVPVVFTLIAIILSSIFIPIAPYNDFLLSICEVMSVFILAIIFSLYAQIKVSSTCLIIIYK